jgi:large subunit ribosomal protein L19
MNNILKILSQKDEKKIPVFKTGDTICVNFNIIDNKYKNRNQNFEGLVLSKKNGINPTCTLRKMSFGEGVEKTFFINSPTVNWIKIKKQGLVRKSKIYYIKKLTGKAAKIREKIQH